MDQLKTIGQQKSLAKLAYEEIRQSIVDGRLTPGEIYQETRLAEGLGISKTPVREALLMLSVDGFVTYLPNKGVRINLFSSTDTQEIFEFRSAIELAIVEKVCMTSESLDFKTPKAAIENQQEAMAINDMEVFLEADKRFHLALAERASNTRMLAELENLRDFIHIIGLEALTLHGRTEEVIAEHQEILRAIQDSELEKALSAMRKHLDKTYEAVLQYRTSRGLEGEQQ